MIKKLFTLLLVLGLSLAFFGCILPEDDEEEPGNPQNTNNPALPSAFRTQLAAAGIDHTKIKVPANTTDFHKGEVFDYGTLFKMVVIAWSDATEANYTAYLAANGGGAPPVPGSDNFVNPKTDNELTTPVDGFETVMIQYYDVGGGFNMRPSFTFPAGSIVFAGIIVE